MTQGQAISTNYFKHKILKEENDSKCRLYKQHEETIDYLTSGCSILVTKYLMRHDSVHAHFYYSICNALHIETTDKWYTHTHPQASVWTGRCYSAVESSVHTDREVTANKPDIIIKNKKEKTCILIDIAIPAQRTHMQKEAEKKLKYKSLCREIQWMWNLKCKII